ncbi:hypothetical protein [Rhodohalobacter sp. SW132]|uniref:hypothetical protein n=1 Tax=Rhodohalobacter sp. SW132 TaxID=2293433 RepID=UPI000E256498|nr:hypothetical protein [Rhodohalobacter sp. SW132]
MTSKNRDVSRSKKNRIDRVFNSEFMFTIRVFSYGHENDGFRVMKYPDEHRMEMYSADIERDAGSL